AVSTSTRTPSSSAIGPLLSIQASARSPRACRACPAPNTRRVDRGTPRRRRQLVRAVARVSACRGDLRQELLRTTSPRVRSTWVCPRFTPPPPRGTARSASHDCRDDGPSAEPVWSGRGELHGGPADAADLEV